MALIDNHRVVYDTLNQGVFPLHPIILVNLISLIINSNKKELYSFSNNYSAVSEYQVKRERKERKKQINKLQRK